MIPIENSVASRVADIHHLMPHTGRHIVGEHFMPVRHPLLGVKGAALTDIKTVESHVHAIGQCRKAIRKLGIKPIVAADTAGSAREIASVGDKSRAAIASRLAADIYGLTILEEDIEDEAHNTTRFIVLSRDQMGAERLESDRHDVPVPRAQRAGRALQGAWWFRHQRRQHDQARELHD
jgi:prephenate dehydratase